MAREPKTKTIKGPDSAGGVKGGLAKALTPSKQLAAVVGKDPGSRPQVVKLLWEYIKKNDLQDPKDKREIVADDILKEVFGKDRATMFEMNSLISKHLT